MHSRDAACALLILLQDATHQADQACFGIGCLPTISAFMQVLQRYFTPHSAAMAEYALANAVINRVKGQAKHPDEAHLSPIASLSSKEGEHGRLLCPL